MRGYADSGFLTSLYLEELTSIAAQSALAAHAEPLPIIPLALLEVRNAINLAVVRRRITELERNAVWVRFEAHFAVGLYVEKMIPNGELYTTTRELSDRYTPKFATRTLDLLHVAAALISGVEVFFSFDVRQRSAAAGEGIKLLPEIV